MPKYRVIDREAGTEDLQLLETEARTDRGWMRVFYNRWPSAPRGSFYPSVYDGRTDVNSWDTGRLVASFVLEDV